MHKTVIFGIAGLALAGVGVWSIAARGDGSAPGDSLQILTAMTDSSRLVDAMTAKLKLSDTQKQQVQSIVGSEKLAAAPLAAQLKEEVSSLRQSSESGSYDADQVTSLAQQTAATTTGLIVDLEQARTQIYAILTPAQRDLAAKQRAAAVTKLHDRIANLQSNRDKIIQRASVWLNLTDNQQQQIQDILSSERQQRQPVVADLISDWQALQLVTANGAFDEAIVTARVKDAEPSTTALIVNLVRTKTEVLAVLTPGQRTQVAEMRDRMRSRIAEFIRQRQQSASGETPLI